MEEVRRNDQADRWPNPVAVVAAILVAVSWASWLTNARISPVDEPPEFGWPLVCQVADGWMVSGGYVIAMGTEYLPGSLIVDALCALLPAGTTFLFVQVIAATAFGSGRFTTASLLLLIAAIAVILAASRLMPESIGALAYGPFLLGLASPLLLLLSLAFARWGVAQSQTSVDVRREGPLWRTQ
ncbi:hypothetical protein [Paludisphaera rhizosphaerae]|uniref:hypothetical protein n=1 Tax=Paludisphaera rhizosphaerae TaxID=2711216 RepID=UPI0013EDD36C|nr:hypothetical protein [Paludisphaera rhizosphaerae]